jgi:DNA polymerase III epsilon subunit-like protein
MLKRATGSQKQVTEEATQYHGITNEDLLTQDSINGLKIKNYVVYWANVYTFRILQKAK